jgi:hypothetical protein
MFELYAQKIDPDDLDFQAFIKSYVAAKDKTDPEAIPYSELYAIIRDGIRDYIHKTQASKRESNK